MSIEVEPVYTIKLPRVILDELFWSLKSQIESSQGVLRSLRNSADGNTRSPERQALLTVRHQAIILRNQAAIREMAIALGYKENVYRTPPISDS